MSRGKYGVSYAPGQPFGIGPVELVHKDNSAFYAACAREVHTRDRIADRYQMAVAAGLAAADATTISLAGDGYHSDDACRAALSSLGLPVSDDRGCID